MLRSLSALAAAAALLSSLSSAQEGALRLVVEPPELTLEVGESAQLEAKVLDAEGQEVEMEVMFFTRSRRDVACTRGGAVTALRPGTFEVVARQRWRGRSNGGEGQASREGLGERLSTSVSVTVQPPALASLTIEAPKVLYVGTSVPLDVLALDVNGDPREDATPKWIVHSNGAASIDAFGDLTLHHPGPVTVQAELDGVRGETTFEVRDNPVTALALHARMGGEPLEGHTVRTGDVLRIEVTATDLGANENIDVPVELTLIAHPDDTLGNGATGQVARIPGASREWRFVAEQPGMYTLLATCGSVASRLKVRAEARDVGGRFTLVGRGEVHDSHTSDLWVWEGIDGRDYCVTGTWGANGDAHFWDVTDPANIERISTVTIDARTVNDVKVSADGRLCVLSREGASNRKNGIVLVDVSDPRNPRIVSGFDDNLTGGVHNVFIDGNEVYALSAGTRYDSIDVSDPGAPARVGSYKVDRPGASIHDVWVDDGLAYSSNWSNGVHIVDVGNGIKGGSPSDPQLVSSYAYPSGWNHAAFPFRPSDSNRFYVAAGDEAFPFGLNLKDKPTYPRGWIHFIDFTDFEQPEECARYEVPEAGTHNLWIEDDVMYVAYYNAGLRAVDVSGELFGDLYRQGREIAFYLSDEPNGYVANAPMAWGPQPHKGHIFFSDWNSGLWAVKLER